MLPEWSALMAPIPRWTRSLSQARQRTSQCFAEPCCRGMCGGAKKHAWRRYYKEFRVYAENAFPTDTFKETPLRELVPLILQAFVDDERQRLGDVGGALPTHSRGWDGAYHSIVLRTEKRATLQEVRTWVGDWLATNQEVLAFITETVEDDPTCQYFA